MSQETFDNPNKKLIKKKQPELDEESDLENEEILEEQKGKPANYVQVKTIYTNQDQDPVNENLSDGDKAVIAGYNEREYQQEIDKEKFARIGYMVWQSKQLYYTAFRQKGFDAQSGQIEWEQRDYKYHQLTNSQKLEIKRLQGAIRTLETKNRLWMSGIVNDALYNDMINRETDIDVEIEEMKDKLLKLKFKSYFLEDNDAILTQLNEVDLRDLVEAAEYRESGVPFSRKRASFRTTSGSATVKAKVKS